jgi:hypothetical protein
MNAKKFVLFLFFGLSFLVLSGQYTSIINSNRPGLTQGAFSIAPGVYQIEFGTSYRKDQFLSLAQAKSKGVGFTLDLRTGLILQNLELIYRVDYHKDVFTYNNADGESRLDRIGTKRNTIGFKILIFDPHRNQSWYKPNTKSYKANKGIRMVDLIPAVSFYAGSELNFGNIYPYGEPFAPLLDSTPSPVEQDDISGEYSLITQNHFLNNYVLVSNWGKRYVGSAYEQNFVSTSLIVPIKKKLVGFIEQHAVKNKLFSDIFITLGAVYLINENIQVDAFASHTLKDTPAMMTTGIGVSYRIDRYNDNGIPQEIKVLRKQRKKQRLDRKINAKELRDINAKNKKMRRFERQQRKLSRKSKT